MCNRRGGGADHVKAVENGFGCSALFIDAERERRVLDFDVEVFGNLVFSDDLANADTLRGVMPVLWRSATRQFLCQRYIRPGVRHGQFAGFRRDDVPRSRREVGDGALLDSLALADAFPQQDSSRDWARSRYLRRKRRL